MRILRGGGYPTPGPVPQSALTGPGSPAAWPISAPPDPCSRVVADPPCGGTSLDSPRAGRQQGQVSSSRYAGGPFIPGPASPGTFRCPGPDNPQTWVNVEPPYAERDVPGAGGGPNPRNVPLDRRDRPGSDDQAEQQHQDDADDGDQRLHDR